MRTIRNEGALPLHIWADEVEPGAMDQARHLTQLSFAHHHIALMPDVHQGYGMPIGGVMATRGAIVPNAVGVDIGCGMRAMPLSRQADDVTHKELERWVRRIRELVPVGFESHTRPKAKLPSTSDPRLEIAKRRASKAVLQIGSLGGGNHFIEFQRAASSGQLWLMVHSGSRNLGLQVAEHYNREAQRLDQSRSDAAPAKWQLAHLPLDHDVGRAYVAEMRYCVDYAKLNRATMVDLILTLFPEDKPNAAKAHDVAHNYAANETHFGEQVWVHRKGATRAGAGELGIIPGSQGTASYIVEGLGSVESFESCSHGAGRVMSRTAAKKQLNLEAEIARLDAQGIVHGMTRRSHLDEAASAYKDIDAVMAQQTDLVRIVEKLTPLAVIKG